MSARARRPRAVRSFEHHLVTPAEHALRPEDDEPDDHEADHDQPEVSALCGVEVGKRREVEEPRPGEEEAEDGGADGHGPYAPEAAEDDDHPREERQQRLEVVGTEERELPR